MTLMALVTKAQAEASCDNLLRHGFVSTYMKEHKIDAEHVELLTDGLNLAVPYVVDMVMKCNVKAIHTAARNIRKDKDKWIAQMVSGAAQKDTPFKKILSPMLVEFIANAHDFVPGIQ